MKNKMMAALFLLMAMNISQIPSIAEPMEYSQAGTTYYNNGVQYLKTNQFTNAIIEFRKALRENPLDKSAKIQLVNAYLSRAQYYNNKAFDYNKAANDIRSAIFYMKYYEVQPIDAQYISDINDMESNLDTVLTSIGADKTAKGHYMMAKSLRAQGEFAAAAVEYQAAMTDSNYKFGSLLSLGEIYYILNLNEQAEKYLKSALDIKPDNEIAHQKLGSVYERMGNLDEATEEYSKVLTQNNKNEDALTALESIWRQKVVEDPNNPEAHANLGAVYQKRGDYDSALTEYQRAENLDSSNITTRLNMGTLYQAKKDYETAIQAYDTITDFNPNYMLAYYYKAQCYKALGNKEAATQNYKLALNLDPRNENIKNELFELYETTMTPQEKLNALYQEVQNAPNNANVAYRYAYELHKMNKLSEAITYYSRVISLDPKYQDAYVNLAQTYKQQGNYDKAREILTNAQGAFPENTTIKNLLSSLETEKSSMLYSDASILFKKGNYNEAIKLYQKISPATPEALVGIGACYQALSENKTAAEYYKKSLELDPKNSETAYYVALAYSNAENFTQAKTYAQKALSLNPNNQNAKELLTYVIEQENTMLADKAITLFDQGQYAQALGILNKVIAQDPKDSNALYYRGMVYDQQKNYQAAINDYKKALQYNPQMIIANYSIAIDYDYLSQFANALSYYKKYLAETKKVGETNDYTRYSQKRLQDLKAYEPKQQPTKPVQNKK